MAEQRKVYTMDEIRKLAPGYRGKAENFDPSKLGRKRESAPPKPKAVSRTPKPGLSSPDLPPPTHPQREPTAQRNSPIISEAIFGIDVSVTEIAPRQEFSAGYQRLIDISLEMYQKFRADEVTFILYRVSTTKPGHRHIRHIKIIYELL
jgi:hypothetical protein